MWNKNGLVIAAYLVALSANSAHAKPKQQYVFKFFSLNPVHYIYSKYSKNMKLNGSLAKDTRYFYRDPSAADRNYDIREVWEYEVSPFKCVIGEGTWVRPDGTTKYTFSTLEPLAIMGQVFETCKTIYSHTKITTKDSPRYSEIWTSDLDSLPFGLIVKFNSYGDENSQVPYNSEELREFKIPNQKL